MKKLRTLVIALGLAAGMTSANVWAAVNCTTTVHSVKHDDHHHYFSVTVCFNGTQLAGISVKYLGDYQPSAPTAVGVATAME